MNIIPQVEEINIPYARNNGLSEEVLIFPKGSSKSYSKYLAIKEFECKCQSDRCNFTFLSSDLAKLIYIVRKNHKGNLWITSGFRCQTHNEKVGGVKNSFHTLGLAVDFQPEKVNEESINELYALCSLFFPVVIKYERFVHCQMENLWKQEKS